MSQWKSLSWWFVGSWITSAWQSGAMMANRPAAVWQSGAMSTVVRNEARAQSNRARIRETRDAIVEAAMWLFATKGYESTSTDEIAAMSGISPRTFFRYFETKDRVLFFGGDALYRALLRELETHPADTDDLTALVTSLRTVAPSVAPTKHRLRLYYRAVESSPVLLGRHHQAATRHLEMVAAALAERRSLTEPDEPCIVLAEVFGVGSEHTYRVWLGSSKHLAEIIDSTFASISHAVSGRRRPGTPSEEREQPG